MYMVRRIQTGTKQQRQVASLGYTGVQKVSVGSLIGYSPPEVGGTLLWKQVVARDVWRRFDRRADRVISVPISRKFIYLTNPCSPVPARVDSTFHNVIIDATRCENLR